MPYVDIILFVISIISLCLSLLVFIKSINAAIIRKIGIKKIQAKKSKCNAQKKVTDNRNRALIVQESVDLSQILRMEMEKHLGSIVFQHSSYLKDGCIREEKNTTTCNCGKVRMSFYGDTKREVKNMHVMLVNVDSEKIIGIAQVFPCIVGRGDNADIIIKDDSLISRMHMAIIYEKEHLYALDLHSTNGTIINGNKISSEYEIKDESIVQIGRTKIKIMIIMK